MASISVPATASVVVDMLNGKRGEEEEALRYLLLDFVILVIALSFLHLRLTTLSFFCTFAIILLLRLLLGIHPKQREEQPAAEEEQVSIFYNYSADELVGNDEDTTVTFEPARMLDWSAEDPHKIADDLEVEKVPDPDNLDPLNLMGEPMVAPPMALQTSLTQTSPAQSSPLSSSPLQNSHILNTPVNTPVQANTIQHKEQQDEDMMAAAIQLNSIMQKQQEGEEGGLRADLIQV